MASLRGNGLLARRAELAQASGTPPVSSKPACSAAWMRAASCFSTPLRRQTVSLPANLPGVDLVPRHAGANGGQVRYAADSGTETAVMETHGRGDVNEAMHDATKYAISRPMPLDGLTGDKARIHAMLALPAVGGSAAKDRAALQASFGT